MQKFNKALKLLVLVCLIVLAGVGIGLSGGAPIPTFKSRRTTEIENTQLVDKPIQSLDSKKSELKS